MRKPVISITLVAAISMSIVGLAPVVSAGPKADDGEAVAKAIVAKYSANPTSVGNIPPIGKPIPRGKHIISLAANNDSGARLNEDIARGGEILGWKVTPVAVAPDEAALRLAFQQAIARKPDGIAVAGLERDIYGDLYRQAQASGIPVVCSACLSRPGNGLVDSHIAGRKMLDLWGQMIAGFTVANLKDTPNVQMFGNSVYPVLMAYSRSYEKHLKRLAPNSTYQFNDLDLKSNVPQQVATVFSAHPETDFVSANLGDFFIGVPQALFAVGAVPGQKPLIGGLTAGRSAVQALKDKTENAWTGYSHPIVGFSVIDSFARYFTKVPFATAELPTQILTQKNVRTAVLTPEGDYQGVKDYVAQFKKIWGVK